MAIQTVELPLTVFGTGEEVRDALLGLADEDRGVVVTNPAAGEFKIVSVSGRELGNAQTKRLNIEYDDQAVV